MTKAAALPWAAIVIALAVFGWRLAAGSHPVDDAYITFRYARNLGQGAGLVYNDGERVLGTSTPLTAVILAGAAAGLGSVRLPEIALAANAAFDAGSVLLLFGISRRLRFPLAAQVLAGCLFGFAPLIVRYSIGGMEAPLATLLTLATVYLFLTSHPGSAAVVAALGIWVRPDMLAIGGALVAAQAFLRDRRAARTAILLAASAVCMSFALLRLYGSPLPHSVIAKAAPIYHAPPYANAVSLVYAIGALPLLSWARIGASGLAVSQRSSTLIHGFLFVVMAGAWAHGLCALTRRLSSAILLGLYPALFMTTYVAVGLRGSIMAEWYLPPLLAVWLVPCVHGLWISTAVLRPQARAWAAPALAAGLLAIELTGFDLGRGPQPSPWLPLSVWEERERLYAEAAGWLRPRLQPGDIVAASEIGSLGYSCDCRILDTAGLVSPEALAYYPLPAESYVTNYAIPTQLIVDRQPTYLVSLEVFMRDTLMTDPRFTDAYDLVRSYPTTAFGSDGLLLYRRRENP